MKLSTSGNIHELGRLERGLTDIAGGGWKDDATIEMATEAEALVADEFASSKDPTGAAWWPTVKGNKPLIQTGAMSTSAKGQGGGRGGTMTIQVTDPKAIWHQNGTRKDGRRHIPARKMLPVDGAMPAGWGARMGAAAQRALVAHLKTAMTQ